MRLRKRLSGKSMENRCHFFDFFCERVKSLTSWNSGESEKSGKFYRGSSWNGMGVAGIYRRE